MPCIRIVDAAEDLLGIEWIEGANVRSLLPGGAESERESESYLDPDTDQSSEADSPENRLSEFGISQGEPGCDSRLMPAET